MQCPIMLQRYKEQRADPHTILLLFLIPTLQLTSAITGFLRAPTALLLFVCFVCKIEVKFLLNNCR